MSSLLYAYAIAPAGALGASWLAEIELRGVADGLIRLVEEGGVAAAVSDVPTEEFDEEPLNELVRDMEWLGPRAIAHQRINERLFDRADALLPLSFGVVFRDEGRLRARLRQEAGRYGALFERLHQRGEWILTVGRRLGGALARLEESSAPLAALRDEVAAAAPGRAHLLKQRLDRLRRDELVRADTDVVRELLEALGSTVDDRYDETLPESAPDGTIARISLLVRRDAEGRFLGAFERVRRIQAERGYDVGVTGPWPPYRFAALAAGAAPGAA